MNTMPASTHADLAAVAQAGACPWHGAVAAGRTLAPDDELVLALPQRMVVQRARGARGERELHLFYGDREISFDEPALFPFGEQLARQTRFIAHHATTWADGLSWPEVAPLLTQLLDTGVLQHLADAQPLPIAPRGEVRPAGLPPAPAMAPRSWQDTPSVCRDLTGVPLEAGWLELVVPVFRVAHPALDADGRQVGESNVFPPALRIDVPTAWRTCIYPGTRYLVDRPMNVSALKAMRLHWPVMMALLRAVRAAYLRRYPEAASGWTVGHIERLSTAALALATWPLVRAERPVASGALHPALASLFRVSDGLRMTMHQMLFVPIGEPTVGPDAPMNPGEILDYAERNHSFHSAHGVCAGPRAMVEEFLATLIDGREPALPDPVAAPFDAAVIDAFASIEPALDYALLGLQAYAAVFSLWPKMTRAYEDLLAAVHPWAASGAARPVALRERVRAHVESVRQASFLANEGWRADRERVYADMYAQCGRGLGLPADAPTLPERLALPRTARHAALAERLQERVLDCWGSEVADAADAAHARAVADVMLGFLLQLQGVLRTACAVQWRINRRLGRTPPQRRFSAVEIDLHNHLQGAAVRRVPYLFDELQSLLQARLSVDTESVSVELTPFDAPAAGHHHDSGGMVPPEWRV